MKVNRKPVKIEPLLSLEKSPSKLAVIKEEEDFLKPAPPLERNLSKNVEEEEAKIDQEEERAKSIVVNGEESKIELQEEAED